MVKVVPDAVLEDTKRVKSSLRPARSDDDGYAGTVGGARCPGLGLTGEPGAVEVEAITRRTGGGREPDTGGAGNWESIWEVSLIDMRIRSSESERVRSSEGRAEWLGRTFDGLRGLDHGLEPARCLPRDTLDTLLGMAMEGRRLRDGASPGLHSRARVFESPLRDRRDGTVRSAERIDDASVASSLRRWDTSVSPENSRFDPFMSFLI